MLRLIIYIIKYRLRSIGSRTKTTGHFWWCYKLLFYVLFSLLLCCIISISLYPYTKLCLIRLIYGPLWYEFTIIKNISIYELAFLFFWLLAFWKFITSKISSKLLLKLLPIVLLNKIVYVQIAHSNALNSFMNKRDLWLKYNLLLIILHSLHRLL